MDKMSYSQVEGILYNYKLIKASIENNKLRLENLELEDLEDGVSAITYGEPSSKTNKFNSVVENATIKNIEAKERIKKGLKKNIARETNKLKMIDNALSVLTETEREIITLFYIEDMTWIQVSMKTNYSTSWCQELRCKAMDKILFTINGTTDAGEKVGER